MHPSVTFKNVRITHSYIIYLVAGMAQRDWLRAAGRQQASHLLKADCVCCNEHYFSVSIHHISFLQYTDGMLLAAALYRCSLL